MSESNEMILRMDSLAKYTKSNIQNLAKQVSTLKRVNEDIVASNKLVREKIHKMEENMTVDYHGSNRIRRAAAFAAIEAMGGKKSNAYKELKNKVFGNLWSEYKRYMGISSYRDTKASEVDKGLNFISNWRPPTELHLLIQEANNQIKMEV